LFFLERYLLLKVKVIRAGKPVEFKSTPNFIQCGKEQNEKVKRLLCELYLHNFFLEYERDANPSPFIRDVQFQAFISFSCNQIKWAKAYNFFQKREHELDLWLRGEHTKPSHLFVQHKRFMEQPKIYGLSRSTP